MTVDHIFSVVYILLCVCLIYPPTEFVTAGLTIPSLLSGVLGKEHDQFTMYHIRKSCLHLFVYSMLPLGYVVLYYLLESSNEEVEHFFHAESNFWRIFITLSLMFPLLAILQIVTWSKDNFLHHPIAKNISLFCNNNMNWRAVANDIDIEFRRVDKICLQTSAVVKIVATENWLLKITPLTMFIVHQSDASLAVVEAQTYQLSHQNSSNMQYLNIEVKSGRQGVGQFTIRINASDFKDLKDRVARTITVMPNVKFYKTVVEQFVDVFKETITDNPVYETNQELEQCIGCLQARPSIKLQKLCEDKEGQPKCSPCYCKPMWCTECLAKWFASRQDAEQKSRWLSSKCTCPMCRATFCLLDVCPLKEDPEE